MPCGPWRGTRAGRAWAQNEGGKEDRRLQHDDDTAGGAIEKIAEIGANEAGGRTDDQAHQDQPFETVGQEIGGGARRHHHGDNEEGSDRLQSGDRGGGEQGEEDHLQHFRFQPHGAGMVLIKEYDHEIAPFQRQHEEADAADQCQLDGVFRRDRQNIAEHDGLDIHRRGRERHHEQAKPEKRGEDQADDRVFLEASLLVQEQHGTGCKPAGKKGTQRKGQAEHIGPGHTGDDGMGKRIADQRPALQHQIGGEKTADTAHQRADPDGVQHIAIGEWLKKAVYHRFFFRRLCLMPVLAILAVDHEGTLVIGNHLHPARIGIVMQFRTAQHEVAQAAAKGLLQVLLVEGIRRLAGRQNRALDEHGAVTELRNAAEIMGGDKHDPAFVTQRFQQRDDLLFRRHVHAGERLIQQDDLAFLRQRPGQKHPLLLPAGKFADLPLAIIEHVDAFQRLLDHLVIAFRRDAQEIHVAVTAHHHHILHQHRKTPVHLLCLRHVGDEVFLERVLHRQIENRDGTGGQRHKTHDRLENCGLAGAIDADKCSDRSAGMEKLAFLNAVWPLR